MAKDSERYLTQADLEFGGGFELDLENLTNAQAYYVRETTGPTKLTVGNITDGDFMKRVGATVVSGTVDISDNTNLAVSVPITLTGDSVGLNYNTTDFKVVGGELQLTGSGSTTAEFVTLALDAGLSAERVLTGTANQIVITDNGANSTVVLSTPQNIHTAATPTFAGLTLTNVINAGVDTDKFLVLDSGDVVDFRTGAEILSDIGAAGAHAILDGTVHTDSVAKAVSRGSIPYGNATPAWDELVISTGFLNGDGTDVAWKSYADTLALLSGDAGASFDWNGQTITNINDVNATTITVTGNITDGTYTSDGSGNFSGVGTLTATSYISCLNFTDSYHYTGFPNRVDTSIAWNDGTYTLTLTATNDKIWINGVEYNINTLTKQLSVPQEAATGLYWFWITAPGGTPQLNTSTTPPDIGGGGANAGFDQCLVATVYWNTTTSKGLLSEERHWFGRDCWWHEYTHETIGARYFEGMGGTFTDTTLQIEAGEFYDEDIEHINVQETVCTVLYHDGDADWAWDVNLSTPYKVTNPGVDDTLNYNNVNALAAAGNQKYVNYWMYITLDTTDPVWVVIGTSQHTLISSARDEGIPSFGSLASAEVKLIYRLTYKNVGGTPDFIESADFRKVSTLPTSTVTTSHTALSDLPWTTANHTGSVSTIAGFDAGGGAEVHTYAETLAILSGTAGAAFDWNGQDLTGVASITVNNSGIHILDTGGDHDLILAVGTDLGADRTLTLTTGDADRIITLSGNPTLDDWFDQDVKAAAIHGMKGLLASAETELTIAGGAITATQMRHKVDTQGDDPTDNLDTLNGGATVNMVVLRAENGARTVVVKHNTGNIWLQGQADVSLDDLEDGILLVWDSTNSMWFDTAAGGSPTAVEAAAVIADHTLVRGDGGARGVQDSGWVLSDTDVLGAAGDLDMNDYDLTDVKDLLPHDGTFNIQLPAAGTVYIKGTLGGGWYNASWDYRVGITSQNAKVAEAVTDGYVDLSEMPSEFWDNVKNGGGDIRVTKADGTTEVAREVVSCDTGTDTGEIHFDCTGIQTGSDIVWYIYYGNAAASDYAIDATYGAENVWQGYEAVHHWQADFLDSTDNDFDGTNVGTTNATGKLGDGQDFDNDHIKQLTLLDVVPSAFTMEIWFKLDDTFDSSATVSQALFTKENVLGANRMGTLLDEVQGKIRWFTEQGNQGNFDLYGTTTSWTGGVWYQAIFTWDTTNGKRIFVNGALEASDGTQTTLIGNGTNTDFYWGVWYDSSTYPFAGVLDESRLSNVIRSTNRNVTIYNNQNDPATFWSIGAEEPISISAASLDVQDYIHVSNTGLLLADTDDSHELNIKWNENEAAADRILNIIMGGADRTIDLSGGSPVTAGNITDHAIVRGHGGAQVVQDSGILIDDSDNVTLPDGASFSLQEDITFLGASLENLVKFPDNLAVALRFAEGGNAYMDFITLDTGAEIRIYKNTYCSLSMFLKEQPDAVADLAAYGQYWVHDDAPCTPWFTDDVGGDFSLCMSDGDVGGSGSAGAGNQYVEMNVGGTTYKVLHDGTV